MASVCSVCRVPPVCLQAALYDVLAMMEQGKAYNADTKIALEVAILAVRLSGLWGEGGSALQQGF